ncbi:class II aldolase/adducin domain-containing protein [Mycena olivaceomarginata]|nr:class II aldolase/adducin domain-containing protein [Mycena olivaceomarginata]
MDPNLFSGKIPRPPVFTTKLEEREFLKFRLAQALRILRGYDEGVAGHITVRDPIRPDCFWVNPFGLHFKLIQPSDLLLKDGRFAFSTTAAFMIHSAIHTARPDVLCAAHSHSTYGKAFLRTRQDARPNLAGRLCLLRGVLIAFQKFHSIYDWSPGARITPCIHSTMASSSMRRRGLAITEALGSKKAVILQNHGLLVASESIEATVYFYIALERACQVQPARRHLCRGAWGKNGADQSRTSCCDREIDWYARRGWFSGNMELWCLSGKRV